LVQGFLLCNVDYYQNNQNKEMKKREDVNFNGNLFLYQIFILLFLR